MVALVLGLLVVGAAIGIFASNRQAYRATENLGRVQENARVSFELMARGVREAGGNSCDSNLPVANVVNGATTNWWTNWNVPVFGFEGGTMPGSLAGTDAIQVLSGGSGDAALASHNAAATQFTLSNVNHGFVTNDVLMICDPVQLSIFRASGVAGAVVGHAAAGGNCQNSLGLLPGGECLGAPPYTHTRNAVVTRLSASRWFIAANGRGTNSLFQVVSGTPRQEIAEGVEDMQITYLVPGVAAAVDSYVNAGVVGNWGQVRAVRFVLTLDSQDRVGTDGNPISRQMIHVVTLRNRNA